MASKRILVVEDDQELLAMLLEYLAFLGYETTGAADGLEGIKHLRSGLYDIVITDLSMPYVSGIGIISIIKKDYPDMPVIAITGIGRYAEELAQEKRADYVLSKPFELNDLKDAIINSLPAKDAGSSHP